LNESSVNIANTIIEFTFPRDRKLDEKCFKPRHLEIFKKCLSCFTKNLLKKTLNKWKRRFTIPLQKKKKVGEIQIKIKVLSFILKNLLRSKKKETFVQLHIARENFHYESIIKNILPLTNAISFFNIKIKHNLIYSFDKLRSTFQKDFMMQGFIK